MTTTPFFKPRITGKRFDGGAIPLEFLADLAVLSEMIQEVAKWKYREENPTRHRVPRGFSDGASLKLTGVEEGSAIPVISLVVSAALLLPPQAEQYYHEARESVVNAVLAAQEGRTITDYLPQKLLGYFDRFGRNLAEGEAIELPSATANVTARLTRDVRRKLVVASSATHYTEEASVYGLVHEFNQREKTFQLTLPEGNILQRIPVESQHYDAILEANNGYRNHQRVRLTGFGRYDLSDRLLELISVEHVVPVDPLDIGIRIEELKQLQPGWLDGKGEAFDEDGLQWLVDAFATQFPDDATLPYLFPTPERNVLAEWSLGPNAVSLEIDLSNRSAEWHVLNVENDQEETVEFDLNSATDWKVIADKLRAMGGAAD